MAVNLDGVFHCLQAELRQMARQGSGSIVNAASMLGIMGYTNLAAYNAAKHAVVGLTRTAALEYAPLGIRVNAVCPAFIETPMVMDRGVAPASNPQVWQALADLHPMQRLGKPGEVAQAIVWLCSDASSFVTGHPFVIDGGMAAGRRASTAQPTPATPAIRTSPRARRRPHEGGRPQRVRRTGATRATRGPDPHPVRGRSRWPSPTLPSTAATGGFAAARRRGMPSR